MIGIGGSGTAARITGSSQRGFAPSLEDVVYQIRRELLSLARRYEGRAEHLDRRVRPSAAPQRPGERVQIFWSLTAIFSLFAIMFILTRE